MIRFRALKHHIKLRKLGLYFDGLSEDDPYVKYILSSGANPEAKLMNFVRVNLKKSRPTIMDIGANIGITSLIMAQELKAKVYAIEPGRNVFEKLKGNISINSLGAQVTPINAAVTCEPGEVFFEENSAYGHMSSHGQRVKAVSVDSFCSEQGIAQIDLIKVDVEGFEPEVLKGISRLQEMPIVYFEYNTWCLLAFGNHNPIVFLEELLDKWDLYYVESETKIRPIKTKEDVLVAAHETMLFRGCVADIVAVAPGRPIITEY